MIGIEDEIYKIGDYKFCNHEGVLYATEWRNRDNEWINWPWYSPVDMVEDVVDALNYFKEEEGLLIRLTGCELKQLLKNTVGATRLNCGLNRFDFIKDYAVWRWGILNRNQFTCECCGSKHNVQVHHNHSFKDHLELATDWFNGTALCEDCHSRFHKNYGYDNISASDVREFIRQYGVDGL